MEEREFQDFDELADAAAEKCAEFFKSEAAKELKAAIQKVSAKYPALSLSFTCGLEVFDAARQQTLPLLQSSLTTSGGKEPYVASADSTPQRFWVNGTICKVPHDRCPNCWGAWDFKFKHTECAHCSFQMGKQVKHMLDTDVCPHCEAGTISLKQPVCDKCGFRVDPGQVVWG